MTRMIRLIKNGISLFLACVLLLWGLAPAVSAAVPTWSESIAPKTTTDVNKVWTVTYSDTIDATTVTDDNVRVVTESGAPVKTDAVVEGKTIRVVPVASYAPGRYLLYVGPGIQSKKGKLQKADIKFSFVVAPESEAKPQVIQSIKEDSVQIGGQQYTVTPQLKELFSVPNKNALKNASVTFTASGSQVTEVQDLYLVNGGDQMGEQVLQGGGGKIAGNLYVESDYFHVRNLTVRGDVLFSESVMESFTADHFTVEGTVTVPETIQPAVQTFAAYPTTRMTIVFQDSSIAIIEISKRDTYVQGIGSTQVTSVAIMANSEVYFDTKSILPSVKISKGVTHIDLNATIKDVVIESSDDIHITGSGDFENVTVSTNKTVDFAAKGSIGNLNMENGTGTIELSKELNVSNVTLPPGKTANDVISNFEGVKDKIEKVDNVDNPDYIPGQVPENPSGHFAAGVSKVDGRYGYVSLNVKNQGSYEVKYLQKDRHVYPSTNTGAIGQQVPKEAISFKNGDQIIQYYGHELFVYQVDTAGKIIDMKQLDDHTIDRPRYELEGTTLTITVPMIPEHLSNFGNSTNVFLVTEDFSQSFVNLTEDKWTKADGFLSITLPLNGDVKGVTKVISDFPAIKFMTYLNNDFKPVTEKLLLNELYLFLKLDEQSVSGFYITDSMYSLACGYYGELSNTDDRCKEPDYKPFQYDSFSMATYRKELLENETSITSAEAFKQILGKVDQQLKDKVAIYINADKQVIGLFKDDFYQYEDGNQLKPETTQQEIDTARQAVNQVSNEFTEKSYLEWLLDTANKELSGESGR